MKSVSYLSVLFFLGFIFLNGSSFAIDERDIGSGIKIISPVHEYKLSIPSNGEILDKKNGNTAFSDFDIDNDGLADKVLIVSYGNSSKFKKNVLTVPLFEKHTLNISKESRLFVRNNMATIAFSEQKPKNETYALAVQLSSKANRLYILTQPGFFPETNRDNLSFAVDVINKDAPEYSFYVDFLNKNNANPISIVGAIVQISGCIPGEDSCEGPIIGVYWNGKVFKSIWAGVIWN